MAVHPEAARGSKGCIAQESPIAIGKMAVGLSHKSQGAKSRHLYADTSSSLANLAINKGKLNPVMRVQGAMCVMTALRMIETATMTIQIGATSGVYRLFLDWQREYRLAILFSQDFKIVQALS